MTAGIVAVAVLYIALRLPLLISDFPNWYHSCVESNTLEVAQSMADNGHPHEQVHISPAGYNLHGILATPVILLDLDMRLVRLVTIIAGAVSILYIWKIQSLLGTRAGSKVATAHLLVAMPHFALMTGFAMPQSVTATFGAISVYYYLRWRLEGRTTSDAVLAALFSGLGAFNHFSGMIIGATVAALFLLELLLSRRWTIEKAQTGILAAAFFLANLPALILWYARDSRGDLHFYDKYQINNSADLLLTASWWRTQIHYTAEYQPVFYAVGLLALYAVASRLLNGGWSLVALGEGGRYMNPVYFWGAWFVIGLLQIPLFPRGSFIHEYYAWWALLPSVPLFVAMVRQLFRGRRTVQLAALGLALALSVTIASAQISRAHGATDIPILCRYQDC